jgi:transposase
MPKKNKNITREVRKLIVEAVEGGKRQSDVAQQFHVNQATVSRLVKKYKSRRGLADKPRTGRPRKSTVRIDRVIKMKSTADPKKTAVDIAREIEEEHDVKMSRYTVARRLKAARLHARVPVKKPWINAKNRKARLNFAKLYRNWTIKDWEKVLWTDESKYCLFGSDGRRYVRRPDGHRNDPRYMTGTVKHGGGSVMVYGAFSAYGVGPLLKIDGIMDGLMFKDILEKHAVPYGKNKLPRGWVMQMDNDPKHRSKVVSKWVQDNRIRVLEWPSQSPDLNPIEHLWNELGKLIGHHTHRNRDDLFADLTSEWNNLPVSLLQDLVHSMPRRLEAVIKSKGFPTKY